MAAVFPAIRPSQALSIRRFLAAWRWSTEEFNPIAPFGRDEASLFGRSCPFEPGCISVSARPPSHTKLRNSERNTS